MLFETKTTNRYLNQKLRGGKIEKLDAIFPLSFSYSANSIFFDP